MEEKKEEFIKKTQRLLGEYGASIFTGRGGRYPDFFGTIEVRSGERDRFLYDVLLINGRLAITRNIYYSSNENLHDYFIGKWIEMFNEYRLVELFEYFFPGSPEERIEFSFPIISKFNKSKVSEASL